jgi:hypothetical protein
MATMFCNKNMKLEEQMKVKVGWRGQNPPKKKLKLEEERGGMVACCKIESAN